MSRSNPSQAAFEKAKTLLLADQKASQNLPADFLLGQDSLEDVLIIVESAKAKYEARSKSKIRRWLASFASVVGQYGRIIDVLVQHHPEYTSFAWGTMKFMFVVGICLLRGVGSDV